MNERTVAELALQVRGTVVGDGQIRIRSGATLEEARPGQITFLANRRYTKLVGATRASAVVVAQAIVAPVTQIVVENPYYAFTCILVLLHGHRPHPPCGLSAKASIDSTAEVGAGSHVHDFVTISAHARVGQRCVLYPGVFVGPHAVMGDDCVIYPNAVIYDHTQIGHRVIIQANATVGEDGFGYATDRGQHFKIPHLGRVILEDDVEVGANCGIERGSLQDTVIGQGSKLGDLVAIGHGVRIGPGCFLVAQSGVAGSTTLGHHCVLAGQAGISGHLKLGDRVVVAAQSGVHRDIPDGQQVFGYPAIEMDKALQAYSLIKSLPEFRKTLRDLEKRLATLEQATGRKRLKKSTVRRTRSG